MPEIPDIRAQTMAHKQYSDDILEVMKKAALERKGMVRDQQQDSLYIDPVTGESYKMTPITIGRTSPRVVLTDGVPGKLSTVFEYQVPEGAELLLPPMRGEYYMVGALLTDDGAGNITPVQFFPVEIVVMDPFKRKTIGRAFSGTADDINQGSANRARGYGTSYNGEFPVRAKNGDWIQFKVFCDTTQIALGVYGVVRWNRISPPAGGALSRVSFRAAMLSKVR